MAKTHETIQRQPPIVAGPHQPTIAIPTEDRGTRYFMSKEEANAAITEEMIAEAIRQAGAWSDLADRDVEGELDRLRHESPPSPPMSE